MFKLEMNNNWIRILIYENYMLLLSDFLLFGN